jgi:hypothetical protein
MYSWSVDFSEYDFQTIQCISTKMEYIKKLVNLTVETFLSLEQIVIFPCDCLDFHEIGYRETMIKLVDDDLPFQYYVKGTVLIVCAVLWMRRSMHPQFLVINAVFQVEECEKILV